jgi:hypothetical protein
MTAPNGVSLGVSLMTSLKMSGRTTMATKAP